MRTDEAQIEASMGTNISVVVITKNEEKNIRACLESILWADEIIVIDSFSVDATVAIAKEYTDKVIQRQWPGMVGPQRNFGLDLVNSQWILFLDADERVPPELKEELLAVTEGANGSALAGARIPRKNYFFGKWLKCSYPNYTSRFLRKGAGRYNEVAGGGFDTLLFTDGAVAKLKHPLIHMTGETLSQRIRKLDFDSSLQADEKFSAGQPVGNAELFFHPLLAFFKVYFFKKGFLDGVDGFIYACLASFSTFLKYAKLWEKKAR